MSEYKYLEIPLPKHIVEQIRADVIDEVMEYTYSMLSDEKMELQQFLERLKEQKNE